MVELKPCPFCGNKAYTKITGLGGMVEFRVICESCGVKQSYIAQVPLLSFTDAENAIEAATELWNMRADNG